MLNPSIQFWINSWIDVDQSDRKQGSKDLYRLVPDRNRSSRVVSGFPGAWTLSVIFHNYLYNSYLFIQILKLIFDVFYCETKNLFELKFQNFPQNKFIVNQR